MTRLRAVGSIVASIAVAVFVLAGAASAGGDVAIQLTIIRAAGRPGPDGAKVDPELRDLKRELEKLPYGSYELFERKEEPSCGFGEEVVFELPDEWRLVVTPADGGEGWIRIGIRIVDREGKEVAATDLRLKDRGTVLVGKELELDQGTILLALTAKRP